MTDTGGVLLNLAGGVALLLWGARMVPNPIAEAAGVLRISRLSEHARARRGTA